MNTFLKSKNIFVKAHSKEKKQKAKTFEGNGIFQVFHCIIGFKVLGKPITPNTKET
jgi:hypothetical protein